MGQVAGFYTAANGRRHAFLWTSAGILDIESDPNAVSSAAALNDAAVVVGQTTDVDGDTIAFRWAPPGPMERLTVFSGASIGGRESTAVDINNAGTIVGYARGPSFFGLVDRGFRLDPGAIRGILLPTLGGPISRAFGINESGAISGQSEAGFVNNATLWSSTLFPVPRQLDTATSNASALNNLGVAVGFQFTGRDNVPRLWRIVQDAGGNEVVDEVRLDPLPGHRAGSARAVSSQSSVSDPVELVGFSRDGSGDVRAVRWVVDVNGNQTVEDLNDLLPAGSGWVLASAAGINDNGLITGSGTLNGEPAGFVFDPAGDPVGPPGLVFVHGILANKMYFGPQMELIWPTFPVLQDLLLLTIGSDGNPNTISYPKFEDLLLLSPKGFILRQIPPYLQSLEDAGIISGSHRYTYDWRYAWPRIIDEGSVYNHLCFEVTALGTYDPMDCVRCRAIVGLLGDPNNLGRPPDPDACVELDGKVQELATQPEGSRKRVWIVAHSYGGLVTKTLLSRIPNIRDHLAGVILVASPQLGTPATLMSALHGYTSTLADYLPLIRPVPRVNTTRDAVSI